MELLLAEEQPTTKEITYYRVNDIIYGEIKWKFSFFNIVYGVYFFILLTLGRAFQKKKKKRNKCYKIGFYWNLLSSITLCINDLVEFYHWNWLEQIYSECNVLLEYWNAISHESIFSLTIYYIFGFVGKFIRQII